MKESESMTERLPLGFDFNKQFKSQNFRATSCSGYRQFYSFTPVLSLPIQRSLWLFKAYFYSLHKNNQLFISSSNGGYQARNKYGHTFVGMVLQIPMMSKDFENCWELERSCVPFVCDGRQLAIVEAAELNINRYLCRSILVHGFPLWIWVYRYKQA